MKLIGTWWVQIICVLHFFRQIKAATEIFNYDFTNIVDGGGANAYAQFNGSNFMRIYLRRNTPNHLSNYNSQGLINERDDTDACADANAVYNTGIVSISMFVYIEDLDNMQYLYCESLPEGTNYNRAFCFGLSGNNQVFVQINSGNPITQDKAETQTAALNYQRGWNMFGVFSNDTHSQVHNVMPDGTTSSTPTITQINQQFFDDDLYITCVGGRRTSTTAAQDAFTGIINEIRFYSDEILLTDLQALVSFTCDNPCPVCLAATAPTCIENSANSYIANWDMAQATYVNAVPDTGANGLDLELLDNQSSYDPIYVDNQGLYFDGTSHIRTSGTFVQDLQNSFTVEGWIRPTATNLDGDLFTFEQVTNVDDVRIGFDGNAIEVMLSGTSALIPITYEAADINAWHYFGISVHKITDVESRVCGVFSNDAETCVILQSVLTLTAGGDMLQVGKNFNGYIKELRVLDWPKVDYEFTSIYQLAGCTAWNGVACAQCPSSNGTCLSTCDKNQYGTTCADCLSPYCQSCWSNTNTECFQCLPDYVFDYAGACPGICGNGLVDLADGEQCDDGNFKIDDGCNDTCQVETDWACFNSSPTSHSICIRMCVAGNYYGFHECADGNLADGDGCDSNCMIEWGYQCIEGDPTKPDTCSELCGDGINLGENGCDDGNRIGGDGCSAGCGVELQIAGNQPMWLCSSGNAEAPDFCHEWCGDGFRHEDPWIWGPRRNLFRLQEVTCDDGNLRSGEGCDGLCRIEEGFVCEGGNETHPDVCKEECGDRRHFYYDQCDDGNLDNDDGCDDGCHEEMGWECLLGSPFNVTSCNEICGDYRNRGWHTCDDGNVVDGDGCSSTCVTEARWYCTGGAAQVGDTCVEVCGDGFNDGTLGCDDMNQLNGDGCNSSCGVEVGWTCTGGNATTKDTCLEICGDGLNKGMWECDDTGTLNGDGCNSTCYIEHGWDCLSGDPSYCFRLRRPWISEYSVNDDTTLITIRFNTTINLLSTWTKDVDMTVQMRGPKPIYKFTWDIVNASRWADIATDVLYISIDYNDQLFDYDLEMITVTFVDRSKIVSSVDKFEMVDTAFDLYLQGKEQPLNEHYIWGLFFFPIFYGVFILISFTFTFLGFSGWMAIDLITTLQMVHLIPVARLYIPSVLRRFFVMFQYCNMMGLNFGFWRITQLIESDDFSSNGRAIGYNFEKMHFTTTSFFNNTSDAIIFITYCCFIPALLALSTELLFFIPYFKKLEMNIKSVFFQSVVHVTMTIMTFSAMMNLYRFNVETPSESAGSYFSVIYMIFLCSLFCYLFAMGLFYLYEINQRAIEKATNPAVEQEDIRTTTFKGKYLFAEYRTSHPMYYAYPLFFILRRIFVASILIYWNDDGFYQLMFLSILSAVNLVYHASYQPFESRKRNVLATMFEGVYLAICMLCFPYVYPELNNEDFYEFPVMFIVIFSIVFVFALGYGMLTMIAQLFRKRDNIPIVDQEVPKDEPVIDHKDVWPDESNKVAAEPEETQKESTPEVTERTSTEKSQTENDQTEKSKTESVTEKSIEIEEESSEEESSDEEESEESSSSSSLGEDAYATRDIPSANVNLTDEAGFSTGLTGLRETKIQKYRNFEKSGKLG